MASGPNAREFEEFHMGIGEAFAVQFDASKWSITDPQYSSITITLNGNDVTSDVTSGSGSQSSSNVITPTIDLDSAAEHIAAISFTSIANGGTYICWGKIIGQAV